MSDRQCEANGGTCGTTEPYEKEIMACGILCGGCGRTRPATKYILADQDGWFDVKEKLPKDGQKCILVQNPKTTATRACLYGIYNSERKKFEAPGSTIDGIHLSLSYWSDIILWMPLPQPPKQ